MGSIPKILRGFRWGHAKRDAYWPETRLGQSVLGEESDWLDKPEFSAAVDGLRAAFGVEFLENVVDMVLGSAETDNQPVGYLLVRKTLCHEL